MDEDLSSEIPHNFDGVCYSKSWKRHKLSKSKSELQKRSLRKGRYSESDKSSSSGDDSDDSGRSSRSRADIEDGDDNRENLADRFYKVKDEASMWVLTQVYLEPKPRHWAKLFKSSDAVPAIVIGSENGGPDASGPRSTKYIFFCYDGYSHADNTSQDDEYTYDRHNSWSLSSRPFGGGFCNNYELRVYQYNPVARRKKVTGRARGWLEANIYIPVDEHQFAGGFTSVANNGGAGKSKTGDASSIFVKGFSKKGPTLTISSDPVTALASLEKLSPHDVSSFLCGCMEIVVRPPSRKTTVSKKSAEATKNQAALIEILKMVFPSSQKIRQSQASAATSNVSAMISALVQPHTLILANVEEFPEELILELINLKLEGVPRLVFSATGSKSTSSSKPSSSSSPSSSSASSQFKLDRIIDTLTVATAAKNDTSSTATTTGGDHHDHHGGLEEVVLPRVTLRPTTKLAYATLRLSENVSLGDERKSYDVGPSQWQARIRDMLPAMEPLLPTRSNNNTGSVGVGGGGGASVIAFRSCSLDQVWYMTRQEAQYCNLVKNMLQHTETFAEIEEADCSAEGGGEEREIPDAGLMDPIPSPQALTFARHFLRYFVTKELHGECDQGGIDGCGDQDVSYLDEEEEQGGESGQGDANFSSSNIKKRKHAVSHWNSLFEAFFLLHIQVSSDIARSASSNSAGLQRAVAKQCWLLGELWGISCYLEIPTLRVFCREAWSRLTAEANSFDDTVAGGMNNSAATTTDSSRKKKRSTVRRDDSESDSEGGGSSDDSTSSSSSSSSKEETDDDDESYDLFD